MSCSKHAQRIGIGEHERGDVFIHLRRQRRHVHHALRVGFQVLDRIADHRRRRRIGAVGRVRNQNFLARMSFRLMIRPHQQQPGQFAVRAGGRLQRDRVHAGDFDQAIAERLDDAQRALGNLLRLIGMSVGQAIQTRNHFIHPRVVLHGAGAQRIHAQINGVIPGGQAGEVADDFDLAHFGHVAQVFSFRCTQQLRGIDFRNIERRQLPRSFSRRGLLEDQSLHSD